MANAEHVAILRQGVEAWNAWREEHADVWPDLSDADFSRLNLSQALLGGADFRGADLSGANLNQVILGGANLSQANLNQTDLNWAILRGADLNRADLNRALLSEADLRAANLSRASLRQANLSQANLSQANLSGGDLSQANLSEADLSGADFSQTYLSGANFSGANLSGTNLSWANLSGANLSGANLSGALLGNTVFASIDLSTARGLDAVEHVGPSAIATDALYISHGSIPEAFLRGCGVPDALIEYLPSLLGAMQPLQFYSCFISYSSQDEVFARRLHERMRAEHLRVWFAPEDMQGGQKLHEQIDEAIRVYDKVLVILSAQGHQSKQVLSDLRKARKAEIVTNRRKLFPIRLMSVELLRDWECIDPTTGQDIADEIRAYHIPDFSVWKDHDAFEKAFAQLLRDLKATDAPPTPAPQPATLSQDEIAGQQKLLAAHRRTLAHELQRLAMLTTAHAPPAIVHGIAEARANIARVKGILRARGVQVTDHPDDTAD